MRQKKLYCREKKESEKLFIFLSFAVFSPISFEHFETENLYLKISTMLGVIIVMFSGSVLFV